jgi:hypothetical protein
VVVVVQRITATALFHHLEVLVVVVAQPKRMVDQIIPAPITEME